MSHVRLSCDVGGGITIVNGFSFSSLPQHGKGAIVFPLFVKTVLDVLWIVGLFSSLPCFPFMNDAKALGLCCVRSRIMYGIMFMIAAAEDTVKNYD